MNVYKLSDTVAVAGQISVAAVHAQSLGFDLSMAARVL